MDSIRVQLYFPGSSAYGLVRLEKLLNYTEPTVRMLKWKMSIYSMPLFV